MRGSCSLGIARRFQYETHETFFADSADELRGSVLGVAAGVLFAVSDIAIKY